MVVMVLAISDTAASTDIFLLVILDSACFIIFNAAFCTLPLGSGLVNIAEWSRSTVHEVMGSPSPSIPNL